MQWKNKGNELNEFYEKLKDCHDIIIFGFGQICKNYINELKKDFNIKCIYDNDLGKAGISYDDIEVVHFPGRFHNLGNTKIIISTHYYEIAKQLEEYGLRENEDFYELRKFIAVWYWYNQKKVYIPEVHVALTTRCSLNCKHCNMYIPHFQSGTNQKIESIKEDIDSYFKIVDKTYTFSLLGGEPFLYHNLDELIHYIGINYRHKIGMLEIVTNGTILPNEDLLQKLKEYNVTISISDYSNYISYKNNLSKFKELLNRLNINYKINQNSQWLDFCFPHHPLDLPEKIIEQHMQKCSPIFKGLNDNKFYFCHIVWSAVKSGLLPEDTADFLDLSALDVNNDIDRLSLLEYSLGYMKKGYVSLCKYCGGCGQDNKKIVTPAIQS